VPIGRDLSEEIHAKKMNNENRLVMLSGSRMNCPALFRNEELFLSAGMTKNAVSAGCVTSVTVPGGTY
jgi:hypothetical protein